MHPQAPSPLTEIVLRRRMVRRYDPDCRPDRPTVDRLLDLARRAPSAGASQGWHFLVLDDARDHDDFWAATADAGPADAWLAGMRTAPVLVLVFSDRAAYERRYRQDDKRPAVRLEDRWPVPYWHVDAGMAALLILLGAVDEGLGACFFGVPPDRVDAVRHRFGVPDRLVPVGVVSLGYAPPDGAYGARGGRTVGRPSRLRPRGDVVSYGRFGATD